jgi:hypothetical protein
VIIKPVKVNIIAYKVQRQTFSIKVIGLYIFLL